MFGVQRSKFNTTLIKVHLKKSLKISGLPKANFKLKAKENVNKGFSPNCVSTINALSANFTKWSNTLKQFFDKLPTNCLIVFDHFVGLALKGLNEFK